MELTNALAERGDYKPAAAVRTDADCPVRAWSVCGPSHVRERARSVFGNVVGSDDLAEASAESAGDFALA